MLESLLYKTNLLGSLSQQFESNESQRLIISIRNLAPLAIECLKSELLSISIEETEISVLSEPIIFIPMYSSELSTETTTCNLPYSSTVLFKLIDTLDRFIMPLILEEDVANNCPLSSIASTLCNKS